MTRVVVHLQINECAKQFLPSATRFHQLSGGARRPAAIRHLCNNRAMAARAPFLLCPRRSGRARRFGQSKRRRPEEIDGHTRGFTAIFPLCCANRTTAAHAVPPLPRLRYWSFAAACSASSLLGRVSAAAPPSFTPRPQSRPRSGGIQPPNRRHAAGCSRAGFGGGGIGTRSAPLVGVVSNGRGSGEEQERGCEKQPH